MVSLLTKSLEVGDEVLIHAWAESISDEKKYRIKFGKDIKGKVYGFGKNLVVVDIGMVCKKNMLNGGVGYMLHYNPEDLFKIPT